MLDKRGLTMVCLLLIVLTLTACSTLSTPNPTPTPAPPTAIPTPTPFAQEGHWEGDPSVSFDVTADGMVRNFRILIAGQCDVRVNVAYPIGADHVFLIGEVDSEGQPVNNGIVGTFDSPTTVTGSFATPWRCGNTSMFVPSPLTTWNAEWQGP